MLGFGFRAVTANPYCHTISNSFRNLRFRRTNFGSLQRTALQLSSRHDNGFNTPSLEYHLGLE